MGFDIILTLIETSPGVFVYDDDRFFPLDGMGFGDHGDGGSENGGIHSYHFTTEVHTIFVYEGGEVFTFEGDDDP